MTKYEFDLPVTGRLSRPLDHSMSYGRDENVWSHITVNTFTVSQGETGHETRNVGPFIRKYFDKFEKVTLKQLEIRKSMKIRMRVNMGISQRKTKMLDSGELETTIVTKPFTLVSKQYHTVTKSNVKEVLKEELEMLEAKWESMDDALEASAYYVSSYNSASVDVVSTSPARGSSYIPTPERFSNPKCGLINIKNTDQRCFAYCMKYHQSEQKSKDHRISVLDKIQDKYNYGEMQFPADYEAIRQFEDLNQVCMYIYTYDEGSNQILLDKQGKAEYILNDCVYLLRIEKQDQSHYIYIKKIERLLNLHTHIVEIGRAHV